MDVDWGGERLILLPDRAVFRPSNRDLLIADPHFGKDAAFRRHGLPVAGGALRDDLARLDRLIAAADPVRLVVLGDFLHSRSGRSAHTWQVLTAWRDRGPALPILLIRGNHDRAAGDPPDSLGIRCEPEPLPCAPFTYVHHPAPALPGLQVAGHVHPGIRIRPGRGPRVRLPCFHVAPHVFILPAFGSFTGLADVAPAPADRLYAIIPATPDHGSSIVSIRTPCP